MLRWGGAALLFVVVCGLAALADVSINQEMAWIFGAAYLVCSLVVAARITDRDLLAAINLPPIVFVLLVLVRLQFSAGTGSWASQLALGLGQVLADQAPLLLAGYLAAVVVAGVRWLRIRDRRQRVLPERRSRRAPQQRAAGQDH